MAVASTVSLIDTLRQHQLLSAAQLDAVVRELQPRFAEPRELAKELVRRGWLTPWQVNQVFLGRAPELPLGPYVLLEKLGEGGMGAVFKARNRKLDTVVALKVIRKDRLAGADALRRFRREIQLLARVDHPNIVRAADADVVGDVHLLAMEFVDGSDLGQLVKRGGPLPVALACEYVRQAALGLQHAHEKGLVHRDIKPANLLLDRNGTIKILDLGLARVAHDLEEVSMTTLTQEGSVMGTPDFMAPEQTIDSHGVDIRADLYSLGCTLYFLLTGRVPFPGGTLGQKIARHQLREPEPVERLRPGLPAAAGSVVRRLMAKKPEERYATPAEAALALQQAQEAAAAPVAIPVVTPTVLLPTRAESGAPTLPAPVPAERAAASTPRRPSVLAATGLACSALLLLGLLIWALWPGRQGDRREPGAPEKPATPPGPAAVGGKAIDLFNGKDLFGWTIQGNPGSSLWCVGPVDLDPTDPARLRVGAPGTEGPPALVNRGRSVNLYTQQEFGDCTIELEFLLPQGSNSGVYVMGEYEVQLLDSYGKEVVDPQDLGAIFGVHAPRLNAAKAPGTWQRLVIEFQAPRFEGSRKTANARFLSVRIDGWVVISNAEVSRPLPQGLTGQEHAQGPLMLQGTHGPAAFRSIRVIPGLPGPAGQ